MALPCEGKKCLIQKKTCKFKNFRYNFKYGHLGICLGGESYFTPCIKPSSIHVRGLPRRGNFVGQLPLRCLVFLQVIIKSTKPLPFWCLFSFKLLGAVCNNQRSSRLHWAISERRADFRQRGGGSSSYQCFSVFWSAKSLHWTLKKIGGELRRFSFGAWEETGQSVLVTCWGKKNKYICKVSFKFWTVLVTAMLFSVFRDGSASLAWLQGMVSVHTHTWSSEKTICRWMRELLSIIHHLLVVILRY